MASIGVRTLGSPERYTEGNPKEIDSSEYGVRLKGRAKGQCHPVFGSFGQRHPLHHDERAPLGLFVVTAVMSPRDSENWMALGLRAFVFVEARAGDAVGEELFGDLEADALISPVTWAMREWFIGGFSVRLRRRTVRGWGGDATLHG